MSKQINSQVMHVSRHFVSLDAIRTIVFDYYQGIQVNTKNLITVMANFTNKAIYTWRKGYVTITQPSSCAGMFWNVRFHSKNAVVNCKNCRKL